LYQSLDHAYWFASTIETKDRLRGLAESTSKIISALNAADIKSRTEDYANVTSAVTVVNGKLQSLQADLDRIVHNVEAATRLLNAITKVFNFAGGFFV
jgi:hypothetical protein